MSKTRTYIDANMLIAAWHGQGEIAMKALAILDDPQRQLVVSDAVWLEIMPKALYQREETESEFYIAVFERAEKCTWNVHVLYQAHELAQNFGIAAMDAIHVATAIDARVDEFVSGERPTKPMFRVKDIFMRSLRKPAS